MKTEFFLFPLLLLISVLINPAVADSNAMSLQDLAFLQGNWKLENPVDERETKFRLNYSFISRDSALVEVYGDPQKQTTQTIIHADQQRLMATHYCARGNQPRLVATTKESNKIQFRFLDVTNLANANDPHMVGMTFTFVDKTHIQKEEVYLVNGKEESSTMKLVRAE
jgi:hypothetical protein